MPIIISGNRRMILNKNNKTPIDNSWVIGGKTNCSFEKCLKMESPRAKSGNDDQLVLRDLIESKEQICTLDSSSKSCKAVTMHLADANKSPLGSPLLLVEPSVLNTVVEKNKPDFVLDVYTTNCQCVEDVDTIKEKLKTGSCDPKLQENRDTVLEYMGELVDNYEKDNTEIINKKNIIVSNQENEDLVNKCATIMELDCTTEDCVLANVIKQNAKAYGDDRLKTCCDDILKPKGPRNKTEWLSNGNTDKTLERISEEFPEFYYFKTTMTDFGQGGDKYIGISGNRALSNSTKNISNLLNEKYTCFGCIINTDLTKNCKNGKCGTHWVCIFIDCRKVDGVPWTIEYFDSIGDPPEDEICKWQVKMKNVLEKNRQSLNETGDVLCEANNIQHQHQNNECGVYCSYFLRARVEGIPFSRFLNRPIGDHVMISYRRSLFSD